MALAPLIGLPSLASHYLDGSRADLRSAIQHIQQNWREGDRVCCGGVGMKIAFDHYAPNFGPYVFLAAPGQSLEELARAPGAPAGGSRVAGGRAWIVSCTYFGGRSGGGTPWVADGWLGKQCRLEHRYEKQRYDHYRYCTDVYLYEPFSCPGAPAPPPP